MSSMTPSRPGPTVPEVSLRRPYRSDIQGLRAVAVLLVLIYHAVPTALPGGYVGVDVFFVISGFLITGLLLREMNESEHISLSDFYARRARRILPAASVVLVATVIASVLILPTTRWEAISSQAIAATFFVANWTFAASSVDYLATSNDASPLQHFWTLGVEEQFYLVWPLVLLVGIVQTKRRVRSAKSQSVRTFHVQTKFLVFWICLLLVPSLVYSALYTAVAPGPAFFVTTTRLWELGIGALTAILSAQLCRIPTRLRIVLGIAGICLIAGASTLFGPGTAFPGLNAAYPVVGASMVIVSGMADGQKRGVGWVLSTRPLRAVGNISYSLYLWHWPVLVLGSYVLGNASYSSRLALVLLSLLPAATSHRYLERRVQRRYAGRTIRSLQVGCVIIAISFFVSAGLGLEIKYSAQDVSGFSYQNPFQGTGDIQLPTNGAALLAVDAASGAPTDRARYSPSAANASSDNPSVYADGCHQDLNGVSAEACVYGDLNSTFTVALVGDSHAAQWVPALQLLAQLHGWRLETFTKSTCPFADVDVVRAADVPYPACKTWNENVMSRLLSSKPDVVFTSNLLHDVIVRGRVESGRSGAQSYGEGLRRTWQTLNSADIPVVVVTDTPYADKNVPECVARNPNTLTRCAFVRSKALANHGVQENVGARGLSQTHLLNLNALICPRPTCAVVVGNVLVYRDDTHLTATYARSLARALDEDLNKAGVVPPAKSSG